MTTTDTTTTPEPSADEKRREAHNAQARKGIRVLIRSVTQGEWLTVCRGLDMTRTQINDDQDLLLLAAGYVREKREHGAASWDVLLGMTDRELLALHGFDVAPETDDETDDEDPETDADAAGGQ